MCQHHVVPCSHTLLHPIVVGITCGKRQGVTLLEAHIAKSLDRIGFLIEVGAVAPQLSSLVTEMDMPLGYLGVWIVTKVVKFQFIRVYKIDFLIRLGLRFRPMGGWQYRLHA